MTQMRRNISGKFLKSAIDIIGGGHRRFMNMLHSWHYRKSCMAVSYFRAQIVDESMLFGMIQSSR
jgi:hypothetical protein